MSQIVVITAVGQDRPGIIAALSGAVYDLGGNLEDATMTRLHGAFAAMISAKLPANVLAVDAAKTLQLVAIAHDLSLTVQTVADPSPPEAAPDHLVTVYGADHPGIVHQITARLAALGINITDMDTRVSGSKGSPLYIMLLEIAAGESDLSDAFAALRQELGVEIALQPLPSEAL